MNVPDQDPPAVRDSDAGPIADALVHIQAAHTSLARLAQVGVIARETLFFERVCPLVRRRVVMVTYGGHDDDALAQSLGPAGWDGDFECIANDEELEPAWFQAGTPDRVLASLRNSGCRSALIYKDQHDGGEVAVRTADLLRSAGLRAGLVARCGYHWSWTVARDTAPNDPRAVGAAILEGELCRVADVVVATTRRIAENLAWQHRLDAAHVEVVPNFVDPPGCAPPFNERTPGQVLFAGRLSAEKRVDLLVRAMTIVVRRRPEAHLVVIGDGPEERALQDLAKKTKAPVEFRPRIPHTDLLAEMGRCAVYAQLSHFEGHPKTILEAMAMGAPVVVSRAPGVDDEIIPGVTGVICGERESDVAEAITDLLNDRARAERIGGAAALDIRARLAPDAVFPLLVRACRRAMETAGVGAGAAPSPVRWDQTLLNAGPDGAALEFASSLGAYVTRLDAARRAMFLDALEARIGSIREWSTIAASTPQDSPVSHR